MTTAFNGVSALIINGHDEMYCEPNERLPYYGA